LGCDYGLHGFQIWYGKDNQRKEMSMSETPRTDKQIALGGSAAEKATNKCDAKFARQLERELNEARKCFREAITAMTSGKDVVYSVAEMNVWQKAAGMKKAK
jgi:hypothetical protein